MTKALIALTTLLMTAPALADLSSEYQRAKVTVQVKFSDGTDTYWISKERPAARGALIELRPHHTDQECVLEVLGEEYDLESCLIDANVIRKDDISAEISVAALIRIAHQVNELARPHHRAEIYEGASQHLAAIEASLAEVRRSQGSPSPIEIVSGKWVELQLFGSDEGAAAGASSLSIRFQFGAVRRK
jgi:hypothetical protein